MGIKETIDKIKGGGKIRDKCVVDRKTGQFECESTKIHEDGSESKEGSIAGGLDANCNIVVDEMDEVQGGAIDRLDKKFISKMKGKCKAKPSDY